LGWDLKSMFKGILLKKGYIAKKGKRGEVADVRQV